MMNEGGTVAITDAEVTRLWRIRRTLLELLLDRGYNISSDDQGLNLPKEEFSDRFHSALGSRESLTMLHQKMADTQDQIYIFFPEEMSGKAIGRKPIQAKADRMETDNIHRGILVLQQAGLTSQAMQDIESYNAGNKFRMEIFFESELLVNITRHVLVPKHDLLDTEDKNALLRRYKLKESQLPRIQKSDPVARYYGLRHGDVVKITRPSETAGKYVSYRYCV